MSRTGLILVMAVAAAACMGFDAGMMFGDPNSQAELSFDTGATEASQAIWAFDPAQHRMEFVITIAPLAQPDDVDVLIVTESGTRFQVLGSFYGCTEVEERRQCERELPAMPWETVGTWRIEATRDASEFPASVDVEVNWVPLRS